MAPPRARSLPKTPMGRIMANTVWLLGGKGFGALCGLAYLAILTHSLGLKGFGHFSLIFGMAQDHLADFLCGWPGKLFPGVEIVVQLPEDPRVPTYCTTDHHCIAASFFKHGFCSFR